MCTIKRAGRWGDSTPSAFYLLNIINDQFLFLIKIFLGSTMVSQLCPVGAGQTRSAERLEQV